DTLSISLYHPPLSVYRPLFLYHLLSFPTRRSSDLSVGKGPCKTLLWILTQSLGLIIEEKIRCKGHEHHDNQDDQAKHCQTVFARSEEHTSELQSRFDLVCRLLLEKKYMTRQKDLIT